jgi:gamma-glutamyltranspeptidase/glutathione hydrolase
MRVHVWWIAAAVIGAVAIRSGPPAAAQGQGARPTTIETYEREQGQRPEVEIRGSKAVVASASPLATLAGTRILQAGGNAIDAAVAVGAALNVTWPQNNQLGGDTVLLIYLAKTKEFVTIDAYSKVPSNPKLRDLLSDLPGVKGHPEAAQEEPRASERGQPAPRGDGVLVSMVPGTAAAWTRAVEQYGTKPLSEVFAPAIEYADQGFPINTALARSIRSSAPLLSKYPSSAAIFLPQGKPLEAGQLLVQKDLAGTFRTLAAGGFDAFYKGRIAQAIASYVQSHGGVITAEDLANYDVVLRRPFRTTYRGYEVVAAPPPTSGIHVLQELNIAEQFDLARMGYHSADALHVLIEATKLAGADRRGISGDPDFLKIPIEGLISKPYAVRRAALIDMQHAVVPKFPIGDPPHESNDTTHFVVSDQWGNVVSATTTLGGTFGSKEVIAGTGILLQDRTWWLALEGPSPNIVAPNHRPNIGHSPIVVLKDGHPFMAIGSPGGDTIRQSVFQAIVNVIDFGLNIQQAIEAPRFSADPLKNDVRIEPRISADVIADLERRGHKITKTSPWGGPGLVEGFTVDPESGNKLAGYDPRANSMAIAW